jgi:methionyl-tRNA formyltransferase
VTAERARVIFLGSGGFAVPILYRLGHLAEVEVVGVVSTPAKPAGRRGIVTPVPVAATARKRGVPLMQPPQVRDPRAIAAIRELGPDLGVLADYGQLVPQSLLDIPGHGFLNVHPSLLPRHRGASPIAATIIEGDAETGVTLIKMDAGLDTGPIVAVERWPLEGTETASELEAQAAGIGAGLLSKTIGAWLRGEIEPTPQGGEGVTLTRPLRREDGRLDVWLTADELERQVRAYQPWPGSFLETAAGRLVVWQATPDGPSGETMPGMIGPGPDLRLATAGGWLRLDEVQPAGGRRMPGDAWLRGRPAVTGTQIA